MSELVTAVKMVSDDRIGGYLVVFGDEATKDLHGDYFTRSTDFGLDWFEVRPALYHHGLDGAVKTAPVGRIDTLKADNVGLWAEAQLDKRNQYVQAVKRLVESGALAWSSGSLPHLVQRDGNGQIKRWPIIEGSLTPTPAEPRMTNVSVIKAAFEELGIKSAKLDLLQEPEPETNAEAGNGAVVADGEQTDFVNIATKGRSIMTDVQIPAADDAIKSAIAGEINEVRGELKGILDGAMSEKTTAIRDSQKALEDKIERLEGALKSLPSTFGQARTEKPLTFGQIAQGVKAARTGGEPGEGWHEAMKVGQSGLVGGDGGFLLPETHSLELFEMAVQNSAILPLIRRIPVNTRKGKFPVAAVYSTGSAGDNPKAGGATGAKRTEGGTYTQTDVNVEEVEYDINNAISGEIPVTKELVKDSPVSLEVILSSAIQNIVQYKGEYLVFNGTGVGEPLGVRNSGALANRTPASNGVFARADASAMAAVLYAMDGGNVRWVAHKSMMSDIDALDVNTYNVLAVMTSQGQRMVEAIKGYQLEYTYNLPQADASGCVMLIDFSQYLMFNLVEGDAAAMVEIDYYPQSSRTHHYWTFDARMDGQPVHRSTIDFVSPGGTSYNVSPYVNFND